MHVIIVGAGPAGLSTALALHQQSKAAPSSPIRVTVIELRPGVQTLGGAINLTPLALRYLDAIGAGARVRQLGVKVSRIEMVSHRTGGVLGKLWEDMDAIRVSRQSVVESLLATARELPADEVTIRYGAKITKIDETGDPAGQGSVSVHVTDAASGETEILECDALIGCDGIHSFVRSQVVDPDRKKKYSGIAGAYGYIDVDGAEGVGVTKPDGSPVVQDSTLLTAKLGSLLLSFFEPSRKRLYVSAVITAEEKGNAVDGWKAMGDDKEGLKSDFQNRFSGGKLTGLGDLVKKCDEWFFFPVYMLPPGGTWAKGRVFLLGDAAHAVSCPIRESQKACYVNVMKAR